MRIQEVSIRNFRALENMTISFEPITSFIGPNGVGKSTVLRALDWFFNGVKSQLGDDDCSFGRLNTEIEVQVKFCDLTDSDVEALGAYVTKNTQTFTAWKRSTPDGGESLSANAKGNPAFSKTRAASSAADAKAEYAKLRQENSHLGLPNVSTKAKILEELRNWESENTDDLEDVSEDIGTDFFGFNGSNKMRNLFNFVFVKADLRASKETSDSRSSIVGRILEQAIDRTAADEAVEEIRQEIEQRQEVAFKDSFGSALESLSSAFTEKLSAYSDSGRSISLRPTPIEFKSPRTTFDVIVKDFGTTTPVTNQGHGFQRTLVIAALQMLAERQNIENKGTICLAIEEPELYQHPIQEQAFAKVLRSLATRQDSSIQVMYATHSPTFVDPAHFHEIRRMVRNQGDNSVQIYSASSQDIAERIGDLTGIAGTRALQSQFSGIIQNSLSVALFANRVILAEGTTDIAILGAIADKSDYGSMERQGIALAAAGSDSCIPLYHAILDTLGIPCYALFDGDAGLEERVRTKHSKKTNEEIDVLVRNELANRDQRRTSIYQYFGHIFTGEYEDFQCDKFSMFSDTLEPHLEANWSEWVASISCLRETTGSKAGKNAEDYRQAALTAKGGGPDFLKRILQNAIVVSTNR